MINIKIDWTWAASLPPLGEAIDRLSNDPWGELVYNCYRPAPPRVERRSINGEGVPSVHYVDDSDPLLLLFNELADPVGAVGVVAHQWTAQGPENDPRALPFVFWWNRGIGIRRDYVCLGSLLYCAPRLVLRDGPHGRRSGNDLKRDDAIREALEAREIPPKTIGWKAFRSRILEQCGATDKTKGFHERTITRRVGELRRKMGI